jgi:D-aspartate ligase
MSIGAARPGQLLLPSSDETAWLYTEQSEALGRYFKLYQPSITCMRQILDKRLFSGAATKAGVAVLPSWEPRTLQEVTALAADLPYPILIKRRTHVHRSTNDKGVVVRSAAELTEQFTQYVARESTRVVGSDLSDSGLPFLQQFVDVARSGVCSVTGFVERSVKLFVTRRSTKVFQRSMPVGVGVCFESLPADPVLADAVHRLCRQLGYFGIFEVEFLMFNGFWAVIDFNPRIFNQVAMDIGRGMPLPLLACLDAMGEECRLRERVAAAQLEPEGAETVFCDGFTMRAILTARTLTGRISRRELEYWRNWTRRHTGHTIDVVKDESDSIPALIHALSEISLGLQAIPKFLRLTPRASQTSNLAVEA